MFGKMRLLVGCRSGMTVKFASKFHHGNPFVRGLLFAGSAVPFRGHCAVRRWCGIGCVGPPLRRSAIDAHLCDVAFAGAASACAKARGCCAGIVRKRFSCVARRTDMPRTFLAWRSFAPMHPTRIRSIVYCNFYVPRRAEEAGKLHRLATFVLQSLLCIRLFARCYSSTSRHSKRVDARFARRTVYRPPSGELVMVLMR